jgi:SsrA-binding protein
MSKAPKIEIVNRKAKFEFHFIQEFEAGIALVGTEVKSIKAGNVNLSDAYCLFKGDELYIKSMFIAEYSHGNINNHESRRDRKLLLRRPELNKLHKKVKEKGLSIVPYKVYFSERGIIKLQIALAQGKKVYDKRQSIKDRESKRDLDRLKKIN